MSVDLSLDLEAVLEAYPRHKVTVENRGTTWAFTLDTPNGSARHFTYGTIGGGFRKIRETLLREAREEADKAIEVVSKLELRPTPNESEERREGT